MINKEVSCIVEVTSKKIIEDIRKEISKAPSKKAKILNDKASKMLEELRR